MNGLIDSNVFIAVWHTRDQYAAHASAILEAFAEGKIEILYTTNYVIVETVNFLLRKTTFDVALQAYEYMTMTDRLKVIYCDKLSDDSAALLFVRHKNLTITDCSLIIAGRMKNIKNIFSFDKGFDAVGMHRLETF